MKLSNLAGILRAAGLTVVETPGWSNRGYAGQDLQDVRGVLWHHTATHRSRYDTSDAPTLSMCINGRSDLPGPLCNIVFGRTGVVYLVAAGVANHAGAGSAHNIPTNWGNHYLIGIEMESSGIAPWDWTADQIRVAPYLGAALERAYGVDLQIAHYEYSSQGKIDPAGWPGGMDGLRNSINEVLNGSMSYASETIKPIDRGFLMALTDKQQEDIYWMLCAPDGRQFLADLVGGRAAEKTLNTPIKRYGSGLGGETNLAGFLAWNDAHVDAIVNAVSAVAPAADLEAIKAAVREGLAGSIEVNATVSVKEAEK